MTKLTNSDAISNLLVYEMNNVNTQINIGKDASSTDTRVILSKESRKKLLNIINILDSSIDNTETDDKSEVIDAEVNDDKDLSNK
jgi:hypothetical protein